MTPSRIVLAIDPGTSKIGMALVERRGPRDLAILWRAIRPLDAIMEAIDEACHVAEPQVTLVGDGTGSKNLVAKLREDRPSLCLMLVNEKDTSYEARARYWEHNPRRGWRRFLPSTLQVPPEPIDDFVAFILAERVLLES